jgi:hypothetical protein
MKEQLVSFETAKLAREKGFNENCYFGFDNNVGNETLGDLNYTNSDNLYLMQPTQSLLQKWLRDVKGIRIIINTDYIKETYSYSIFSKLHAIKEYRSYTYEEALEEGLKDALKLI